MANLFQVNRAGKSRRGRSRHCHHGPLTPALSPAEGERAGVRGRKAAGLKMRLSAPKTAKPCLLWLVSSVLLLFLASPCLAAPTTEVKAAELKIFGYGFLGNRELKRMLKTLELGRKKPQFFGSTFIEDASLILSSRIKRDGYLQPNITAQLELEQGGHMHFPADELLETPLPRPLRAVKVHFHIRKGVLYHYKDLNFEGLETMTQKQAKGYFIESGTLLRLKRNRIYTPEKLQRGLANLTEVLERAGYEEAKATVANLNRDDKTGAVGVRITVHQGLKSMVHSVREEFFYEGAPQPKEARTVFPNKAYSKVWLQDFSQSLKTNQYHR